MPNLDHKGPGSLGSKTGKNLVNAGKLKQRRKKLKKSIFLGKEH